MATLQHWVASGSSLKVSEVLALLERHGWFLVSQRGSHRQYKHQHLPGRVTVAGCVAAGRSQAEVESAIKEAISMHLDGLREDGLPLPPATSKVEYVDAV